VVSSKIKWKQQEVDVVRRHYMTEKKDFILNLLPGRTWRAIGHIASRLGVKRERCADSINIKFFNDWSQDMAYVSGFIAADGNISDRGGIQIHLSYKDIGHLRKIKNTIEASNKIVVAYTVIGDKQYKKCIISFGSKYMSSSLVAIGIGPRKSLTLEFPKIPYEYLSHFIRGYFDGDGCIASSLINIDLIGTYSFLDTCAEIFYKECGVARIKPKKKKDKNAFNIVYNTKNALKVLRFIYRDAEIYLDRKFNLYQKMEETRTNYKTFWDKEEIDVITENKDDMLKMISMLDSRTESSIRHKLLRLGLR